MMVPKEATWCREA